MDIHFIFVESLAIIQLISVWVNTVSNHLRCTSVMVVAARISQVLSSSLWDDLVSIFLLLIGKTIDRSITCDILLSNLNSGSS